MPGIKIFVDGTRDFPESGFECCRDAATAKMFIDIFGESIEFMPLGYNLGASGNGMDILYRLKAKGGAPSHINIRSDNINAVLMLHYIR